MFQFNVAADLHKFGITEDGEDVIGFMVFVEAIGKDGQRYVHQTSFPSITIEHDEDEGIQHYITDVERAHQLANESMARLRASNVDVQADESWHVSFAVYGSAAYNEQDTIAWEQEF